MDRMTKETTTIPQMRAPPTTDTPTTTGLKRAAEEPVEEIDAERALEPRPEEVDMELNTIENLKHILELETHMEDNFDEYNEGMYMDDGVDWWPLEEVQKGDLKATRTF